VGAQAEAEDAVQEIFLPLWTHAARWQPGKAEFETWLHRVMLNQCYDRLRRRPAAPLEAAVALQQDVVNMLTPAERKSIAERIKARRERLSWWRARVPTPDFPCRETQGVLPAFGSRNSITLPWPGTDDSRIAPPMRRANSIAIARPSPAPVT
jgi:sigma-70-like protein